VGWVPDLSLAGDKPASPSVRFRAGLSAEEERTASFLNVWIALLDLEFFIQLVLNALMVLRSEWGDRADMRIALTTTAEAVFGFPSRFPFADEVTRRFLLATAGTDDGNQVILKPLRSRLRTHYLMKHASRRVVSMKFPCQAKRK
jgi:hypothetical protein